MSALEKVDLSSLDGINPALTRFGRTEAAPILPLREEPDLLTEERSASRAAGNRRASRGRASLRKGASRAKQADPDGAEERKEPEAPAEPEEPDEAEEPKEPG